MEAARRAAGEELINQARNLFDQWRANKLGASSMAQAFKIALDALGGEDAGGAQSVTERYLALFAPRHAGSKDSCWPDSHLTVSNLPATLQRAERQRYGVADDVRTGKAGPAAGGLRSIRAG
jgi:hypothetical protein